MYEELENIISDYKFIQENTDKSIDIIGNASSYKDQIVINGDGTATVDFVASSVSEGVTISDMIVCFDDDGNVDFIIEY